MGDATCLVVAVLSPVNKFIEFCHEATLLQAQIISFPDLLWTKPKARSGKVIKFVFLNWRFGLLLSGTLIFVFSCLQLQFMIKSVQKVDLNLCQNR